MHKPTISRHSVTRSILIGSDRFIFPCPLPVTRSIASQPSRMSIAWIKPNHARLVAYQAKQAAMASARYKQAAILLSCDKPITDDSFYINCGSCAKCMSA